MALGDYIECWECYGKGYWMEQVPRRNFWSFFAPSEFKKVKCDACDGKKVVLADRCEVCGKHGDPTCESGPWKGRVLCPEHMWDSENPGQPAVEQVFDWEVRTDHEEPLRV